MVNETIRRPQRISHSKSSLAGVSAGALLECDIFSEPGPSPAGRADGTGGKPGPAALEPLGDSPELRVMLPPVAHLENWAILRSVELICPDPDAMVRAANVHATLDAFRLLVPTLGRLIVERHHMNIDDFRPDKFVFVQSWLDTLRDIQSEVGTGVVRGVGMRIIENANFPPQFSTLESVLDALDTIYHLNHRGEVGHYHTTRGPDGSIVVRCETPYPRHFERGLIEGICRNKLARGTSYRIGYVEGPPGGDLTCTLTVRRRQCPPVQAPLRSGQALARQSVPPRAPPGAWSSPGRYPSWP